jgi:hypothetical protein
VRATGASTIPTVAEMSPIDAAGAREFLEAIIAAFSIIGGGIASLLSSWCGHDAAPHPISMGSADRRDGYGDSRRDCGIRPRCAAMDPDSGKLGRDYDIRRDALVGGPSTWAAVGITA